MNKTPISIALNRQIPEYIREEYELFVKFVKAYYEFLNETQSRDLEDIRSIEKTLDEFVIRFKKELSVLFPTNTLANERFILQRIREFYKTRGSKESYQFLFRALFNKDAEIFYPSTQMLRVSDGKWIQEKSVFVQTTSGNLFNLSGKIININTSIKTINVFCPRVVFYRDDIYEVFIERAYTQDISIGNTVSSTDDEDYGTILPCPTKYTITKGGAGFEVGKLYYLKSEQGDGSLIKITKIATAGAIKKIQIISFGLDYTSTFSATLSNKQATALIYHIPITSFTIGSGYTRPSDYNPQISYSGGSPYQDGLNGFIDYGYINKQDYFLYDKFYTPADNNSEKVFYADATYVGEIVGSFYTNSTIDNVIDSDSAEIRIELGAVAIYPGYYETTDGFISDECYIQDGKYYQLFSYVIRVEQQIDSYYNIVKQLLHPAGLELYAQYNIKNDYIVAATPLLAFIRRQFLEEEYVTDDEGTNFVGKISSDISFGVDVQNIRDISQPKVDSIALSDDNYRDVSKILDVLDSLVSTSTSNYYNSQTQQSDSISTADTQKEDFTRGLTQDSISTSESGITFGLSGATWTDSIILLDEMQPVRYPVYEDVIYMDSFYSGGIQYPNADAYSQIISYFRSPTDSITLVESAKNWDISGGTFNKTITATDSSIARTSDRSYTETINNTNTGTLYVNPYSQEGISVYDYFASNYGVADTRALL